LIMDFTLLERKEFTMRRFAHPIAAAVLLAAILFTGSMVMKADTAQACSFYQVPGSHVDFFEFDQNINVSLTLWYNNCTGSSDYGKNYAEINIYTGSAAHAPDVFVHRLKGPDGPDTALTNFNCPTSGICDSPKIYDKNEKAQACFQDPYLINCTDLF
jgi:hypothetical protein